MFAETRFLNCFTFLSLRLKILVDKTLILCQKYFLEIGHTI